MRREITYKQYRAGDLFLFTLILLLSEAIIHKASTDWFPDQLYVVSPVGAITAIVMMRWSGFSVIHAALGGLFYGVIAGGSPVQLLVYTIGNLFSMAALLFFRRYKKEAIRSSTNLTLVFGATIQLLMLAGRAVCALLTGLGSEAATGMVSTDILSLVFTLVILWAVRRIDGLFEDQKHYLFRIQRQVQAEQAEADAFSLDQNDFHTESIQSVEQDITGRETQQ